jgi:hypothetical protein
MQVSEEAIAAFQAKYDELIGAQNALVGCAMFGPESSRKRDLPRIVERLHKAEREFNELLESAGLIG